MSASDSEPGKRPGKIVAVTVFPLHAIGDDIFHRDDAKARLLAHGLHKSNAVTARA